MNLSEKKLKWIIEQVGLGYTVYLTTYTRATKITGKHVAQIRVRGDNLEIQHGTKWLNHNHSHLSAQRN